MPPNDVASAIVTERSKELLKTTYLGYIGIFKVMNDIRRTVPVLSRVHKAELGYMVDDVVKYNRSLRAMSVQLGMNITKIKEMGEQAKKSGLTEGEVSRLQGHMKDTVMSKGTGYEERRNYLRLMMAMRMSGVKEDEISNLTPKNMIDVIARKYGAEMKSGGQTSATNYLNVLEKYGVNVPGGQSAIDQLYRTSPAGRSQLMGEGRAYREKRQGASVSGLRGMRESGEEDKELSAKMNEYTIAVGELSDSLHKLKEVWTNLIVRKNIDFFTYALKILNNVVNVFIKLGDVVSWVAERLGFFLQLPFTGMMKSVLSLFAVFMLWRIIPAILGKILVNLGIGNTPESVSQIVNQLLNILPERINNGSSPGQPA